MLTLLLLGALFPIHIARAWRGHLNRISSSIMVICNAVLILTAFARGEAPTASIAATPAASPHWRRSATPRHG